MSIKRTISDNSEKKDPPPFVILSLAVFLLLSGGYLLYEFLSYTRFRFVIIGIRKIVSSLLN